MAFNLDEIKKLSTQEKLKIIDEIWSSIDDNNIETEEDQILRERIEKYEKGEMTFRSWEEAKKTIQENLKKIQSERK